MPNSNLLCSYLECGLLAHQIYNQPTINLLLRCNCESHTIIQEPWKQNIVNAFTFLEFHQYLISHLLPSYWKDLTIYLYHLVATWWEYCLCRTLRFTSSSDWAVTPSLFSDLSFNSSSLRNILLKPKSAIFKRPLQL